MVTKYSTGDKVYIPATIIGAIEIEGKGIYYTIAEIENMVVAEGEIKGVDEAHSGKTVEGFLYPKNFVLHMAEIEKRKGKKK